MSANHDISRVVRSWIREEEHDSADRVLQVVLSRLDSTPQRRSRWPARRSDQMNTSVKAMFAAAAALAIAVIGYNLLPPSGGFGGRETPAPTASNQVPSPSARPPAISFGSLAPGTYRVTSFTNQPLTLRVPAGWGLDLDNFISKGDVVEDDGVRLATWTVSHIYADSCQWEGTLREARTADEIVTALVEQTGHDTSAATPFIFGGVATTRLVLSVDTAFDITTCDEAVMRLWPDAGPLEEGGLPIFPGLTTTVYVVDHGEDATLVVGMRNVRSSASDVAELDEIINSIQFEP